MTMNTPLIQERYERAKVSSVSIVRAGLSAEQRPQPGAEVQMPAWALGPGSEADDFGAALDIQRDRFLGPVIVQPDHDARSARLRHTDVRRRLIGMGTLGPPIFHKFIERVILARMCVRAAP